MQRRSPEEINSIFVRRRRIVAAVLLCVLAFTGFFIYRTVERARYWQAHADEPIKSWMTIGYVARSRRVPRPVLRRAVGLDPETRDRRPIAEIAEAQQRPEEELIWLLEAAVEKERSSQGPAQPGGDR